MMRIFHGLFILFLIIQAACSVRPFRNPHALPQIQYSAAELQKKACTIDCNAGNDKADKDNKTYLSLDLPYSAFQKILKDLEVQIGTTLKNRGEAHITVISPPEFNKLQKKISMKEINVLADEMSLSQAPYKLLCIGKGSLSNQKADQSTYYAVVESERLFQIRTAIQKLYIKKGGKAADFNAEIYYPHVTLGFTDKDLYYEDGVKKDSNSCIYSLSANNEMK
ncbi:MAG: hypothetical protein ACXVCY_17235 [Pseudobdellovibrionaceae bacterium]